MDTPFKANGSSWKWRTAAVSKNRKIGLTSRAMQQASQITEPDYAPLMDRYVLCDRAATRPSNAFIAPRVEVELAFVLRSPLTGPDVTIFDVLRATDYVTPALEIIDARIEQFDRDTRAPRKVFDTIAVAACAGIVVRKSSPSNPMRSICAGWRRAVLYKNAVIEADRCRGSRADVILPRASRGWPIRSAPHGESLRSGDILLGGSFTETDERVARRDVLHADYGPLGGVSMRFV